MKQFGMIGAAGYIAPRHMRAILETGNELVAAMDINDSVGIIDSYFPNAHFFTDISSFQSSINNHRRKQAPVDYISVTSPNHLHEYHSEIGLRLGCDVICEKPLALTPKSLDEIQRIEHETKKTVSVILQLRLLPSIERLKNEIKLSTNNKKHVILTYVTARGNWYFKSWKGDPEKSGGVMTNIGIHFFDLLIDLYGPVQDYSVHQLTEVKASGILELEHANVRWLLSIDENDLPNDRKSKGARTFRELCVDGEHIDLSDGFSDLHTKSYQAIINGRGFSTEAARPAVELVDKLRRSKITAQGISRTME